MANKANLKQSQGKTQDILDSDFKTTVLSMLKELKKNMEKESKEIKITHEQNENVNKRDRNYKKNQILEIKI